MSVETTGAPQAQPQAAAPANAPASPQTPQTQGAPTINYHIAAPNAAAPAQAAAATPPAAVAPAAPQTVTIPLEQLQAFTGIQARLAEMEARQRSADETHQRELQNAMLARGQAEDAVRMIREQSEQQLQAERDRAAETQRQAQTYAIDVEVARAMSPHQFSSSITRQAFEGEVRRQLIADANGKTFVVRTPTFQTAEQVVAGMVANPEYAPFLAPRGVSGTATGQSAQTPPAPSANPAPPEPEAPRNLGRDIIRQAKDNAASRNVSTDPRFDPSRPMGLGPAPAVMIGR